MFQKIAVESVEISKKNIINFVSKTIDASCKTFFQNKIGILSRFNPYCSYILFDERKHGFEKI
jgi:hypothetical protein